MATISTYNLTVEELEETLTDSKNVYVEYLVNNDHITKDQAVWLSQNTAILVRKPNFFSRLWNKYIPGADKNRCMVVVEQKSLTKDSFIAEEEDGRTKLPIVKSKDTSDISKEAGKDKDGDKKD